MFSTDTASDIKYLQQLTIANLRDKELGSCHSVFKRIAKKIPSNAAEENPLFAALEPQCQALHDHLNKCIESLQNPSVPGPYCIDALQNSSVSGPS